VYGSSTVLGATAASERQSVIRRGDPTLDELLEQLRVYVASSGGRAFFAPAASAESLNDLERHLGRRLPPSYRQFLSTFDGGFTLAYWDSMDIDEDASPEERAEAIANARWNTIYFRGATDLLKEYNRSWSVGGTKPFIPFCQTINGESLVFGHARDDGEAPVMDAFHENVGRPDLWGIVYPDFPTMLRDYLANRGEVRTSA
jgi:hypothetical protein